MSDSGAPEAAASVIGSTLDYIGTKDTNAYNRATAGKAMDFTHNESTRAWNFSAEQAKLAREFDLYTANTQMQRRKADLIAAGMNPMLAYTQGGASAPVSPSPSGSGGHGTSIPAQNPMRSAPQMITTALQAANLVKTNSNIDADTALKASTAALNAANLPPTTAKGLLSSNIASTGNDFIDVIKHALRYKQNINSAKDVQPSFFQNIGKSIGNTVFDATHLSPKSRDFILSTRNKSLRGY